MAVNAKLTIEADVSAALAGMERLRLSTAALRASTSRPLDDITKPLNGGLSVLDIELSKAYRTLRAVPTEQVKAKLEELRAAYDLVSKSAGTSAVAQQAALQQLARRAQTITRNTGVNAADSLGIPQQNFDKLAARTPAFPAAQVAQADSAGGISFGKLTGGIFAADAALSILKSTLESAAQSFGEFVKKQDEFARVAELSGINAKAIAEYDFALTQSDATLGDFSLALKKLSTNLVETSDDSSKAADTFNQLGINVKELGSIENIIPAVADAIKNLGTEQEKTAAAVAIFGKSAQNLLPFLNKGADGIQALRSEAERLGATLSEDVIQQVAQLDDAIKKLSAVRSGNLDNAFAAAVPAVKELVTLITEDLANSGETLGKLFASTAENALEIYKVFSDIKQTIDEVIADVNSLTGGLESTSTAAEKVKSFGESFRESIESTKKEIALIVSAFQAVGDLVAGVVNLVSSGLVGGLSNAASVAERFARAIGAIKTADSLKENAQALGAQSQSFKDTAQAIAGSDLALDKYNKKLKETQATNARLAAQKARFGDGYGDLFVPKPTGTFKPKADAAAQGPKEKDKTVETVKAKFDLIRQAYEAELSLQKQYLESGAAAYERAYRDGEISLQEFVLARVKIAESANELERETRARELVELDKSIEAANAKGDQLAAFKFIKEKNAIIFKTQIDEAKLQETITRTNDELKKIDREIKIDVRLAAESFTGKVDIEALRKKLEQSAAGQKLTLRESPEELSLLNKGIEAQIQAANARNQLKDTEAALTRLSEREALINAQRNAGVISDLEANRQLLELYTKEGEAIAAQRQKLSELFQDAKNAGLDVQSEGLRAQLAAIEVKSTDTFGKLNAQAKSFGDSFADAFGNAFQTAITGSESFGSALRKNILGVAQKALGDLARNIFQEISRGILGSSGGNSGGAAGGIISKILEGIFSNKSKFGNGFGDGNGNDLGVNFADGGGVKGYSPHSRADNIKANLTAGEYVHSVPSVKYYGDTFMGAINKRLISRDAALGMLSGVQRKIDTARQFGRTNYADGGEVQQGYSRGMMTVNVTNTGTPQTVVKTEYEQDGRGAILNILLEDAERQGPVFRRYKDAMGAR